MTSRFWTIPNAISLARVAMIPFIVQAILRDDATWSNDFDAGQPGVPSEDEVEGKLTTAIMLAAVAAGIAYAVMKA